MTLILAAIGFLTVVPVPVGELTPRRLGWVAAMFPCVGLLVGAFVAVLAWAPHAVLPVGVRAALAVGAWAFVSGGLHLDGLADLFDALGGGWGGRRERMLEIMHDSRIGAHGASALGVVLLLKWSACDALLTEGGFLPMAAAAVASRAAVVCLIAFFRDARSQGLGHGFARATKASHALVANAAAAALLLCLGTAVAVAAVAALGASLVVGVLANRRLGGLTGDVYGAAIEISEVVFLLTAVAMT